MIASTIRTMFGSNSRLSAVFAAHDSLANSTTAHLFDSIERVAVDFRINKNSANPGGGKPAGKVAAAQIAAAATKAENERLALLRRSESSSDFQHELKPRCLFQCTCC